VGVGQRIVAALGGKWYGSYGVCRCPAHDDRSPSLSIKSNNSSVLFYCHAGCAQAIVLQKLRELGFRFESEIGIPRKIRKSRDRRVFPDEQISLRDEHVRRYALKIWQESQAPRRTLVETYLARRSAPLPSASSDAIRFCSALRHPTGRSLPAMVAAITDATSSRLTGIHRTFLDPHTSEKAAVKPARMILGRKRGGVIRLISDNAIEGRLAYAEGIETALSAISAGWPCWSAIDAGNMAALPVWPWIDLTIFVDHDAAGIAAAETLARRWKSAGGNAVLIRAPQPGEDWNDVARRIGRAA
jgi:putative DNA primase/helicase